VISISHHIYPHNTLWQHQSVECKLPFVIKPFKSSLSD